MPVCRKISASTTNSSPAIRLTGKRPASISRPKTFSIATGPCLVAAIPNLDHVAKTTSRAARRSETFPAASGSVRARASHRAWRRLPASARISPGRNHDWAVTRIPDDGVPHPDAQRAARRLPSTISGRSGGVVRSCGPSTFRAGTAAFIALTAAMNRVKSKRGASQSPATASPATIQPFAGNPNSAAAEQYFDAKLKKSAANQIAHRAIGPARLQRRIRQSSSAASRGVSWLSRKKQSDGASCRNNSCCTEAATGRGSPPCSRSSNRCVEPSADYGVRPSSGRATRSPTTNSASGATARTCAAK